jgi:putative flavoprotein involved in K+ transport
MEAMGVPTTAIHTVVVGAGQAGLIASSHLRRAGREHVVLERRDTLGGGWQDRWDAFRLVTPNFVTGLPDFPYVDGEPNGFMTRDEIARRTATYARVIDAPVRLGTVVRRVSADDGPAAGFRVETDRGTFRARQVVVATGAFHTPKIPTAAAGVASRVRQLHAHHYRHPAALPPGGVLVIGSGQTGVQIAEELQAAGRPVTLSVGHCGRAPRRYRGHDYFWWIWQLVEHGSAVGTPLPTVASLPDPRMRFACNAHLSGHGGGHDTNLRRFAAGGMRLVGRFESADGERVTFAPDLSTNLRYADEFFDARFRALFDAYAERAGIDAPADDREPFVFEVPEVTQVDLAADGIATVLWTTGYTPDYGWLDLPVLDEAGLPRHVRGVSAVPGLTFLGLLWQLDNASASLAGVASDAAYLADHWSA